MNVLSRLAAAVVLEICSQLSSGLKGRFCQPRPIGLGTCKSLDFDPERVVHRLTVNRPFRANQIYGISQAFGLG